MTRTSIAWRRISPQRRAVRVGNGRWQLEGCPLKRISVAAGSGQEYVAWYAEMETPKGVWLGGVTTAKIKALAITHRSHPDAAVSDAPATAAHGEMLWVVWHAKTEDAGRGIYLSISEDGGASLSLTERLSDNEAAAFPAIALSAREAIIGWETGGRIVALRRARATKPGAALTHRPKGTHDAAMKLSL